MAPGGGRPPPRPAAFLDRDGVLIVDSGYPHRPEDLVWMQGAAEAVCWLNARGYHVIVVTNQSGVARGYFSEADVDAFHDLLRSQAEARGGRLDAIYSCPFHPQAVVERYRAEHPWRKPAPGMILQAIADLEVRREGSFLVGDKPSDLAAAEAAGLPGFLATGRSLLDIVREAVAQTSGGSGQA